MNDDFVLNGQHEQAETQSFVTPSGNIALQESGVSNTSSFLSEQIRSMLTAPDFRQQMPYLSEKDIQKRSAERWINPLDFESAKGTVYEESETSDSWTIAKDAAKRFWMQLSMDGDYAEIAAGNLAALSTGDKLGVEMQKRAYDTLDSKMAKLERTYTRASDLETFTADATGGVFSMLEMFASGIMTGGIAPMIQMGVESAGKGTYNNMRKYAQEHGDSIEGYEGNWIDTGIDLVNASAQAYIEKLGFGSSRWLKGAVGKWIGPVFKIGIKEAGKGALQEAAQQASDNLAEYLKGNSEDAINWRETLRAGIIGGFLQGALGAAVQGNARLKADKQLTNIIATARMAQNPKADLVSTLKESRKAAEKFNDEIEEGAIKGTWDELSKRIDTNNDKGVVRDNLVKEFTKARKAALGLDPDEDLDADEIADIQDAATVASAEAVRQAWTLGVAIEDTPTARLTAEGKDLVVRDLSPEEKGALEKRGVDIKADEQKLAELMATGRERAEARRTTQATAQAEQEAVMTEQAIPGETEQAIARQEEKYNQVQQRLADIEAQVEEAGQQSLKAIETGDLENEKRGKYNPVYQRIILKPDSDVSTILHELSHMWLNNYFKAYRSVETPDSFKKMWKPVEKALGLREFDRYLDKQASEKFARSFEKWVMDGGKGAEENLQPVYERLSKRIADVYDDLATRYFDMVDNLKPEIQNWFAKNEAIADSFVVSTPKKDEETDETVIQQERKPYRNRAEERKQAIKKAKRDAKIGDELEKAGAEIQDELNKVYPNLEPSGKTVEHETSKGIRDRLSAKGIVDGYKNMYEQEATMELAEKVRDYVAMAPDEAFEVAMGRKNAPQDLPNTMVYTAVANYLDAEGDVAKLWELQQSPIVEYRSEIARELQRGRDFFHDGNGRPDIPRIVKYLNKAYEKKLSDADKNKISSEAQTINDLIVKADLNYEDAWNNILKDVECKA